MCNHFTSMSRAAVRAAVAEGKLVDLTLEAQMLGFRTPVVATAGVVGECLCDLGDAAYETCLRLNVGLLRCLAAACRACLGREAFLAFHAEVQFKADREPRRVELKAVRGPVHDGQPCLIVMLAEEN